MPDIDCPVCSTKLKAAPTNRDSFDALSYDCPQCGKYVLDELAKVDRNFHDAKQLISAWIRFQNKRGNNQPFISDHFFEEDWFKNLRNMGFPQTVNKKLDELLLTYTYIVGSNYLMVVKTDQYHTLIPDIAAKNYEEIKGLNKLLIELGYLSAQRDPPYQHVSITANGWLRAGQLLEPTNSSDLAFVAMWYDPSLDKYREAVKTAIIECGYEPIIIDELDFNDFIMDKVIHFIRQARFLVTDLTCSPEIDIRHNPKVIQGVRGGVYWEAGMAYGLGKTVIQTCRDDDYSKRRIHFDRDQYQTMFWKQEELTTDIRPSLIHISDPTFTEKLALRILQTLGKGHYITPV